MPLEFLADAFVVVRNAAGRRRQGADERDAPLARRGQARAAVQKIRGALQRPDGALGDAFPRVLARGGDPALDDLAAEPGIGERAR